MITGGLRNQVDKLWTEFWTGGITNPLMVIEQVSFLMFARLMDTRETREEKRPNKPDFSRQGKQNLRWSQFRNVTPATEMFRLLRDEVLSFFKEVVLPRFRLLCIFVGAASCRDRRGWKPLPQFGG